MAYAWQCWECGQRFRTARAAERAINDGCPGCGGVDIDIARTKVSEPRPRPKGWDAIDSAALLDAENVGIEGGI